jgi:hypothetical protein
MNPKDYNETLEILATMVRPIKAALDTEIENLKAENRNIRQRLTFVENQLHRRDQRDQTTKSLRAVKEPNETT